MVGVGTLPEVCDCSTAGGDVSWTGYLYAAHLLTPSPLLSLCIAHILPLTLRRVYT